MDYTQRHFEEYAEVRQSCDEDEDVVLKTSNFPLMEIFFVSGGKDPCFFYKKIMEIAYPPRAKKSSSMIEDLKFKAE